LPGLGFEKSPLAPRQPLPALLYLLHPCSRLFQRGGIGFVGSSTLGIGFSDFSKGEVSECPKAGAGFLAFCWA